jgi:hypothetical protein
MKKKFGIIITFIFLLACSDKQTTEKSYDKIQISKTTQLLVDSIAKCTEVDTEETGFGGGESECYKSFHKLVNSASDDELIYLTNHPDTVVRVYAFWGLAKRNYKDIITICKQHKNDTVPFVFMNGDAGVICNVNEFYLMVLSKNIFDTTCKKLPETTIVELKREFGVN